MVVRVDDACGQGEGDVCCHNRERPHHGGAWRWLHASVYGGVDVWMGTVAGRCFSAVRSLYGDARPRVVDAGGHQGCCAVGHTCGKFAAVQHYMLPAVYCEETRNTPIERPSAIE